MHSILPEKSAQAPHIIPGVAFRPRRLTVATLAVALVGAVLFALALKQAGVSAIVAIVGRIGWGGFAVILLLSGTRFAARALGWMQCVEGEAQLRFRDAFTATLMGEALGNVTPLATVLSEPAKAVLVRERLPLMAAFSALLVENIVYAASVAGMIVVGGVAFLSSYDMEPAMRVAAFGAVGGMLAVVVAAVVLLGTRASPVSGVFDRLATWGALPRWIAARAAKVRRFEESVSTFALRAPGRFARMACCEALFHAAGVAEVFVVLLALRDAAPTLLVALILESTGRAINVAFRFVPMRVGVDEAGSGLMTLALGLGSAPGVALGLVRKARMLVWTGLGVALLLHRGLSVRRALDEAAAVTSDRTTGAT